MFTPRTLFLYRKDIIGSFAKVMGELAPDVSISDDKTEDEAEPAKSLGASRSASSDGKAATMTTKSGAQRERVASAS